MPATRCGFVFFGDACILIETKDKTILIDPLVSYEISEGISRYTYHDLPDTLDYIVITHDHQDHCFFETLLQCATKSGTSSCRRTTAAG